ncbi:putative phage abortive infection protein [Pseudomonas sp. FH1]|uniref:putative phage abortive infection protein n=1 Tax=Pseudomonas sp. FH1 TaxID=1284392 RepID=UPI00138F5E12|nr:putative phage abortive infection protein [Pseudomonas sp. FH1]
MIDLLSGVARLFFSWMFSFLVIAGVLCIYFLFFDFLISEIPIRELPELIRKGEFGDSFGTLNALFSGLAFSGVLITLLLQRRDLYEARSQGAQQQIESQFYNMLALQQGVLNGFDVKRNAVVLATGRDCFKKWYRVFESEYRRVPPGYSGRLDEAYEIMWLKFQGDLSLYFRSLYSVFKFISESEYKNKKRLGNIARSLLSDFELVVLFYGCLDERGKKFQAYICEFEIFDNLDVDMLVGYQELHRLPVRAYGANKLILAILKGL